jgi:hypothetical protein
VTTVLICRNTCLRIHHASLLSTSPCALLSHCNRRPKYKTILGHIIVYCSNTCNQICTYIYIILIFLNVNTVDSNYKHKWHVESRSANLLLVVWDITTCCISAMCHSTMISINQTTRGCHWWIQHMHVACRLGYYSLLHKCHVPQYYDLNKPDDERLHACMDTF